MGAIALSFLTGGGLLTLAGKALDFLKSPLGIVCIIAAVGFGGHLEGKWAAEKVCRAEKQESISAAKEIDLGASINADEGLRQALDEANERLLAAQVQLREQAADVKRLPTSVQDARRPTDTEWGRLLGNGNKVRSPRAKPPGRR